MASLAQPRCWDCWGCTGLPQGLTAFLTALVLVSGYFFGQVLNTWWIFRYLNETIGKNDLFLGAGLLAVIVHAPIGSRENRASCYPPGPDAWPSFVNDPQRQKGWTMVYEDKGGRLNQRLK